MMKSPSSTRAANTSVSRTVSPASTSVVRRAGPRRARRTASTASVRAGLAATGRGHRGQVAHDAHSAPIRPLRTRCRKNGTPTSAVITPTWTSPGGSTTRPTTSAADDQHGAVPQAERQHPAVVGPHHGPHRVRDDQADERHGTRQRGRRCRPAAPRPAPMTSRSRPTRRPSPRARSSPRASAFRRRTEPRPRTAPSDEEREPDQEYVARPAADRPDLPEPEGLDRLAVAEQHGPASSCSARP